MLETSKDLLLIVLAVCIIALTAFGCWLMYYFIAMAKNAHTMVKGIKTKFDAIDDILKSIKNKVNNTGALIAVAMKAFERVGDYVSKKQGNKSRGKKKKGKEEKIN